MDHGIAVRSVAAVRVAVHASSRQEALVLTEAPKLQPASEQPPGSSYPPHHGALPGVGCRVQGRASSNSLFFFILLFH